MNKTFYCEHHQCDHEFFWCGVHDIYFCNMFYHGCPAWHGGYPPANIPAKVVNINQPKNG